MKQGFWILSFCCALLGHVFTWTTKLTIYLVWLFQVQSNLYPFRQTSSFRCDDPSLWHRNLELSTSLFSSTYISFHTRFVHRASIHFFLVTTPQEMKNVDFTMINRNYQKFHCALSIPTLHLWSWNAYKLWCWFLPTLYLRLHHLPQIVYLCYSIKSRDVH